MTQISKEMVTYLKKRYDINISTTNYITSIIDALMTDKQKLNRAILLIKALRQDAKLALNGGWDRSDEGFEDQITLIDTFFSDINKEDEGGKLKQIELPL